MCWKPFFISLARTNRKTKSSKQKKRIRNCYYETCEWIKWNWKLFIIQFNDQVSICSFIFSPYYIHCTFLINYSIRNYPLSASSHILPSHAQLRITVKLIKWTWKLVEIMILQLTTISPWIETFANSIDLSINRIN